jgi:hypothetical protein
MEWLRRIYRRLPVVRELRRITDSLGRLEADTRRQTLQQLNQYTHFTLLAQEKYRAPKRLNRHEFQVFSQGGADGVLAEIFRRVGISQRFFVEVGVSDGLESNTAYLVSQGWKGLWVEGDAVSARAARRRFEKPMAENIEEILGAHGVPREFDLFSLDIDRNTYWVWAALRSFRPRVAVVEYNATFPPDTDWKVDYAPRGVWDGTTYFGASLKALEILGRELHYSLVGCDLSGVNAFFVRDDLVGDRFAEPFTAENHYEPARYFLIRREAHSPGVWDRGRG